MRKLVVLIVILATGCSDSRCSKDPIYCSDRQGRMDRMRELDDDRLVKVARIEFETSNPPGSELIYEMVNRGEDRAKQMYFTISRDSNEKFVDESTRVFSNHWDVCGSWINTAPFGSDRDIRLSCYRVLEKPIDLRKLR